MPANTSDWLLPMELSINKPVKEFLWQKFQEWYSTQIVEQLDKEEDIKAAELQPVDLCLPVMKELGTQWLVEAAVYITQNPQFIVNEFIWGGISKALDGESVDLDNDQEIGTYDNYSDTDAVSYTHQTLPTKRIV